MLQAWHALALPVLMIFSLATLPHHLKVEVVDMLKLGSLPHILEVRADLTLLNISYKVEKVPDHLAKIDYASYLTQFIKTFEIKYGPFRSSARARAKVIIFCWSKWLVDTLFNQMDPQVARFHADLFDQAKLDQLDQFQSS
jgi:superfamily II DNA helicase RecQ